MFMKKQVLGVAEVKRWATAPTPCLGSKQENKAAGLRPLDLAPRIAFGKYVCLCGTGQSLVAPGFTGCGKTLQSRHSEH